MSATFNPGAAATLLTDALRSGVQFRDLPAEAKPATLASGYDVQDQFMAALGDPLVGWKLGVGSANAMRRAKLARPLVGQVGASRCFAAGDTVPVPAGAVVTIEFEIAVRLARDVPPCRASSRRPTWPGSSRARRSPSKWSCPGMKTASRSACRPLPPTTWASTRWCWAGRSTPPAWKTSAIAPK
ncbi:hypothetical protein ACU4GI_09245 [Cupriavidus basilensis]